MNIWAQFKESLPDREAFYSKLRNEECSETEYAHAVKVWTTFNCNTVQDYHDLYLKTDVLILADVFENFRAVCRTQYQLDPAHYVSSPQLSWDAMLKKTEAKLELISDPEMFNMIDKSIRGGVASVMQRHSSANNKYMGKFNPDHPSKYIFYTDCNNLYGWAMSQYLPIGDFKWLTPEEAAEIIWTEQKEEQSTGYFVECDLEYPAELHQTHNDFPLAPERLLIQSEQLSATQLKLKTIYNLPRSAPTAKLIPNLMPKSKYVTHYLNLKFYLEHGMRLSKVHRVISFNQSPWLRPYIQLNQQLRAAANNDFDKDFFKLMNNSVYGKTTENVKKMSDIRLCNKRETVKKLVEKPHCMGFRIFNEDLAGVQLRKITALINKPFYVGFTVLELAKLLMYRFHYD